MVTELLRQKLQEKRKIGLGEGAIKTALMGEGWPLVDIQEALETDLKGIDIKKSVKKSSLIKTFGFTFFGLLIGLFLAYLLTIVYKKQIDLSFVKNLNLKEFVGVNTVEENVNTVQELSSAPTASPTKVDSEIRLYKQESLLSEAEYLDKKVNFRIFPPKGWEVDTSGKLGASLYFLGEGVLVTGDLLYRPNISVQVGPANNNGLENYVDFYIKTIKAKLNKFELLEKRKITISGSQTYIIRNSFEKDKVKFFTMTLLLVAQDKAYVVTGISPEQGYEKIKQSMDSSVYSFNLL